MKEEGLLKPLYVIVFTLLIVHEIDSAFWKEWELFHLPGGIVFFSLIHVFLVPVFLLGYGVLCTNPSKGIQFSLSLSVLGICTMVIHTTFMVLGHNQFKTPVSIAIIGVLGIVSVFQMWRVLSQGA